MSEMVYSLREWGLERKFVKPDGECAFRAFADQLASILKIYVTPADLRDTFVALCSKPAVQQLLMSENPELNAKDFEEMKNPKEWNQAWGDVVVAVLAMHFNVHVVIHQMNRPVFINGFDPNRLEIMGLFKGRENADPAAHKLHLVLNEQHYDSTQIARVDCPPDAFTKNRRIGNIEPHLIGLLELCSMYPAFQEEIRQIIESLELSARPKTAVIGESGVGKSTTMNFHMATAEQSPENYARNNLNLKARALVHGLQQNKLITDEDEEAFLACVNVQESKGEQIVIRPPPSLINEAENDHKDFVESVRMDRRRIPPFLLPTDTKGSTTATITQVRPGNLYQLLIIYKSIRSLEQECVNIIESLSGTVAADRGVTSHQINEWKERLAYLTGVEYQQAIQKFQETGGVDLCDKAKELVKHKKKLFSGTGDNIHLDRFFMKTRLAELNKDTLKSIVIDRVEALVPCDIPIMVDNPGIADSNMRRAKLGQSAADEAHVWTIFTHRYFSQSYKAIEDMFLNSEFTTNLFAHPAKYRLAMVIIGERPEPQTEETVDQPEKCQWDDDAMEDARKSLSMSLEEAAKTDMVKRLNKTPQQLREAIAHIMQRTQFLVIYPVLYMRMLLELPRLKVQYPDTWFQKIQATHGPDLFTFFLDLHNGMALEDVSHFANLTLPSQSRYSFLSSSSSSSSSSSPSLSSSTSSSSSSSSASSSSSPKSPPSYRISLNSIIETIEEEIQISQEIEENKISNVESLEASIRRIITITSKTVSRLTNEGWDQAVLKEKKKQELRQKAEEACRQAVHTYFEGHEGLFKLTDEEVSWMSKAKHMTEMRKLFLGKLTQFDDEIVQALFDDMSHLIVENLAATLIPEFKTQIIQYLKPNPILASLVDRFFEHWSKNQEEPLLDRVATRMLKSTLDKLDNPKAPKRPGDSYVKHYIKNKKRVSHAPTSLHARQLRGYLLGQHLDQAQFKRAKACRTDQQRLALMNEWRQKLMTSFVKSFSANFIQRVQHVVDFSTQTRQENKKLNQQYPLFHSLWERFPAFLLQKSNELRCPDEAFKRLHHLKERVEFLGEEIRQEIETITAAQGPMVAIEAFEQARNPEANTKKEEAKVKSEKPKFSSSFSPSSSSSSSSSPVPTSKGHKRPQAVEMSSASQIKKQRLPSKMESKEVQGSKKSSMRPKKPQEVKVKKEEKGERKEKEKKAQKSKKPKDPKDPKDPKKRN